MSASAPATPSSSNNFPQETILSSSTNLSYSHNQRVIIILSAVLGFLGVLLIAGLVVLIIRYRRQHGPRGASPIGDEEILSWRRSGRSEDEKRQDDISQDQRAVIQEVPELPLEHQSGWIWTTTTSSGSIHTIPHSFPNSPAYSPTYIAPNARAGLTDETIPGEEPFIAPTKRRLSKPPHARTKSSRSSASILGHSRASSEQKTREWYENYDDAVGSDEAYMKEMGTIGFPRFSTFDETTTAGGLTPRPQPVARMATWERKSDIGRAIA